MILAVIFDLDDTLYAERDYAFSGFAAVAREFADVLGDPEKAAARMRQLFDTPDRGRVFNAMLGERGEDAELIQQMVESYRRHRPAIQLQPDAAAALARLASRYRLGLITDGQAAQQWAKIDALNLRPHFDQIIVTSECAPDPAGVGSELRESALAPARVSPPYGKPHPLAFEQMERLLEAASAQCAYVADNPRKDFIAPNRLGWRTIQVRRKGGIYEGAEPDAGAAANRVIGSLDELDPLLA